jgi:hypothetical protein
MLYLSRRLFQEHLTNNFHTYHFELDFLTAYHYFKNNFLLIKKLPPQNQKKSLMNPQTLSF